MQTDQDDILAQARGARGACQNALPSMDPAGLLIIPVPRGQKTCIHRRTFISSTKRSASQRAPASRGTAACGMSFGPPLAPTVNGVGDAYKPGANPMHTSKVPVYARRGRANAPSAAWKHGDLGRKRTMGIVTQSTRAQPCSSPLPAPRLRLPFEGGQRRIGSEITIPRRLRSKGPRFPR